MTELAAARHVTQDHSFQCQAFPQQLWLKSIETSAFEGRRNDAGCQAYDDAGCQAYDDAGSICCFKQETIKLFTRDRSRKECLGCKEQNLLLVIRKQPGAVTCRFYKLQLVFEFFLFFRSVRSEFETNTCESSL